MGAGRVSVHRHAPSRALDHRGQRDLSRLVHRRQPVGPVGQQRVREATHRRPRGAWRFLHTRNSTPSRWAIRRRLAGFLQGTPEDPTQPGWGGQFVRAWERPPSTFDRLTTTDDRMEVFGILELVLSLGDQRARQARRLSSSSRTSRLSAMRLATARCGSASARKKPRHSRLPFAAMCPRSTARPAESRPFFRLRRLRGFRQPHIRIGGRTIRLPSLRKGSIPVPEPSAAGARSFSRLCGSHEPLPATSCSVRRWKAGENNIAYSQ